jgi:hypothetical protein
MRIAPPSAFHLYRDYLGSIVKLDGEERNAESASRSRLGQAQMFWILFNLAILAGSQRSRTLGFFYSGIQARQVRGDQRRDPDLAADYPESHWRQ